MPPSSSSITLSLLRAAALRTLTRASSVQGALDQMGFVQADPIRAPTRSQDLVLMQRVNHYHAGDLERLYPQLDAEEDLLPNYGFFPRRVQALLHPREPGVTRIEREHPELVEQVRSLLAEQSELHPREVAAQLGLRPMSNAWGGQSQATTRALEALHYRGEARITRRIGGVRVYGPAAHLAALRRAPLPEEERLRGAVHLLASLYGPLPEASLSYLISLSRLGFPHLHSQLRAAFKRAVREELTGAQFEGVRYVWPADWTLDHVQWPQQVTIVSPFDPLVWDRRRFLHLHGWAYRFEAYTPAHKRAMGYYALPVFQGEKAIGWANLKVEGGTLKTEFGFTPGIRQTKRLLSALEREIQRYRTFLNLPS